MGLKKVHETVQLVMFAIECELYLFSRARASAQCGVIAPSWHGLLCHMCHERIVMTW